MSPISVRPREWKTPAAMISIAMLTSPAIVMAITTSICSKRKMRRRSSASRADHAALRQRRVQVDDVRHHGRAEDAGGQEHALGAGEARREEALHGGAAVGVRVKDLEREAGHDDADERP